MRRARQGGEGGVALIELALVVGLLAILLSGVIDVGMGWRRSLEMSGTLRSGARVASNLGTARSADLETLRALSAGIAEMGSANVNRVIIYKSTTANGSVPPECKAVVPNGSGAGLTGKCNVYSPSQLSGLTPARFSGSTSVCQGDDWDQWYCPLTHREGRQGSAAGADFVGIWIEVEYQYIVGLLPGNGITMTDEVVMRIEPGLG